MATYNSPGVTKSMSVGGGKTSQQSTTISYAIPSNCLRINAIRFVFTASANNGNPHSTRQCMLGQQSAWNSFNFGARNPPTTLENSFDYTSKLSFAAGQTGTLTAAFRVSNEGATSSFGCTFSNIHISVDYTPKSASTFTLNKTSVERGSTLTANVTAADSTFTHTIDFKQNGAAVITKTLAAGTNSVTLTATEINQFEVGAAAATLTTKSGSDTVGTPSTLNFNVSPNPSEVIPTITVTAAQKADTLTAAGWNFYLQGNSCITLTAAVNAGNYGATISQITYSVGTQTAAFSDSTLAWTSAKITQSGTVAWQVSIRNSYGQTATASGTIEVIPYAAPKFTSLTAQRCSDTGTPDSNGEYAEIETAVAYSSVNGNNTISAITAQCRTKSGSTFGEWQNLTGSLAASATPVSAIFSGITGAAEMQVRVIVSDSVQQASSAPVTLSTADVVMFFKEGGKNACMGYKSDRENALNINPDWSIYHGDTNVMDEITAAQTAANTAQSKANAASNAASANTANINKLLPLGNYVNGTNISTTMTNAWSNIYSLTITEPGAYLIGFSASISGGAGKAATFDVSDVFYPIRQSVYCADSALYTATGLTLTRVWTDMVPKTLYLRSYTTNSAVLNTGTSKFFAIKLRDY